MNFSGYIRCILVFTVVAGMVPSLHSADFAQGRFSRDVRSLGRLVSISENIRADLRLLARESGSSEIITGELNHHAEKVLIDYARVRSHLANVEKKWQGIGQAIAAKCEDESSPRKKAEQVLSNALSLGAAVLSLENSQALVESIDASVLESRANRPLSFRGKVYVKDLFADVDYQLNSAKRRRLIAEKVACIEDNGLYLDQASFGDTDADAESVSLLLGLIDSSGALDEITSEHRLVAVGRSVRARMRRFGYSLGKAFTTSFEFLVSVFSRPTVHIKVRKPRIRDEKMEEVIADLSELCKPCDIFLHKTAYQANDWVIPGYFSHSGMWVGSSMELEELGLFDPSENQFSYDIAKKNEAHLREHPVFEGLFGGVQSTTLKTYMLPCDTIAVLRFKEGYLHNPSDIVCKAVSHLGQDYDFGFNVNNMDTIVCSELIYQSYPSSIEWPVTKALGRYTFSPDEIGSMGRASLKDAPFEVIYFHDGKQSYQGAAAVLAYESIVVPKLKFGEPVHSR